MKDGTVRAGAVVEFGTAHQAQRPVAGVPVVARIARELDRAGYADMWIAIPDQPLDREALAEVHRLASGLTVHLSSPPDHAAATPFPSDRLIAAEEVADYLAGRPYGHIALDSPDAAGEILLATGKSTDGVVSRRLNRPVSRRISVVLLQVPGIRPIHATVGTAAIAAAMFLSLVFGGRGGLVVGALLFHGASVFDGVDGEIARATFRTSRKGAALDSAIDAATNVAAMLGLAVNLALRGRPDAMPLVTWGLTLFVLGLAMIGRRSMREKGSVSFDGVKERYQDRFSGPIARRMMALATIGTSRDFCALVYVLLVLLRIPIAGLYLFAVVTPVWTAFVAAALWRDEPTAPRRVTP